MTQGYVTLIDESDQWLLRWRWKVLKADGLFYACRTEQRVTTVLMHRVIMCAGPGQYVDHRDHDGLHNWRGNLRISTQSQNLGNARKTRGKSQYKGVYWNKEKGLWQAQISNGKTNDGRQSVSYLGRFQTEEEAARRYNEAALERWGEFAHLNQLKS